MFGVSLDFHHAPLSRAHPHAAPGLAFSTHGGVPRGNAGGDLFRRHYVRQEPLDLFGRAAQHAGPGTAGADNLQEITSLQSVAHVSWLSISVVADGAVPRDVAFHVATDTPAHRKGLVDLLDHCHFLDLSMAGRTVDFGSDVPQVRKMDVVRDLVDPNPGNRLLPLPVAPNVLDLSLLPFIRAQDELVTPPAGRDRRDTGIDRPLCREVAVLAVDLVLTGVNGVRERDRLDLTVLTFRDRRTTFLRM